MRAKLITTAAEGVNTQKSRCFKRGEQETNVVRDQTQQTCERVYLVVGKLASCVCLLL